MNYQLAQINIAKAKETLDSLTMKTFVDQLDKVNRDAELSPGFIWRLVDDDSDNAIGINAFDDELIIVNMSVWKDVESLKNYVFGGDHLKAFQNKKSWFNKLSSPSLALWWIPEGHIPTVLEGKEKLQYIETNGASESAFTIAKPFPAPEA